MQSMLLLSVVIAAAVTAGLAIPLSVQRFKGTGLWSCGLPYFVHAYSLYCIVRHRWYVLHVLLVNRHYPAGIGKLNPC